MEATFRQIVSDTAAANGCSAEITPFWEFPATPFAPHLVERISNAAQGFGFSHRPIVSGAGHDAVYIARVIPTAMVFIPCQDGISHNEAENITPEQAARGAAVLYHAVLETAS
jgi:N-carbamoyl-L-amino-acid hydrolase